MRGVVVGGPSDNRWHSSVSVNGEGRTLAGRSVPRPPSSARAAYVIQPACTAIGLLSVRMQYDSLREFNVVASVPHIFKKRQLALFDLGILRQPNPLMSLIPGQCERTRIILNSLFSFPQEAMAASRVRVQSSVLPGPSSAHATPFGSVIRWRDCMQPRIQHVGTSAVRVITDIAYQAGPSSEICTRMCASISCTLSFAGQHGHRVK